MSRWLKSIPGFRSNTGWKKLLALVGYLAILGLLLSGPFSGKLLGISCLAAVLLASNALGLRTRVPFFNSTHRLYAASAWVALGVVALVALSTYPSSSTPQRANEPD